MLLYAVTCFDFTLTLNIALKLLNNGIIGNGCTTFINS